MVPPHCASRRGTMHEDNTSKYLHPPGLEMVPLDREDRDLRACGSQERPRVSSSYQQFLIDNVTVYQARMIMKTFSECKSREQWRTDQHVHRCVKSDRRAGNRVELPRRSRVKLETFASLAEEAIRGASQKSACTGV